jgi:tetratricopeptide (TPR) repeat protein
LYESTAAPPEKRLSLLEANHSVLAGRDDALAREISMKVVAGKYNEAIQLMTGRHFAIWEGTNLNVADDWTSAHLLRGQQRLAARQYREALADFQASIDIPDNLPSTRGPANTAESQYWIGVAYEGLGNQDAARKAWTSAAAAPAGPTGRGGSGGRAPRGAFALMSAAQTYYRALALRKLGQADEAGKLLQELVSSAAQALQNPGAGAPGPGRGLPQSRTAPQLQAHYAAALGHAGLGEKEPAKQSLQAALAINPAHLGARTLLDSLNR